MEADLKLRVLKLLKEDEEFRYAVAGLIGLEEILRRLDRHDERFIRIGEEIKSLREEMKALREDMIALRKDMNKGFELVNKRLRYLEAFTVRVSLTLEEEAIEVVTGKLSEKGIKIKLARLILPDIEINIYGVADDVCVIGEASTRAGTRIIEEINEKVKQLSAKYPEHMRGKVIKILYTMWITDEALEEAKSKKIWVLKTTQELTSLEFT